MCRQVWHLLFPALWTFFPAILQSSLQVSELTCLPISLKENTSSNLLIRKAFSLLRRQESKLSLLFYFPPYPALFSFIAFTITFHIIHLLVFLMFQQTHKLYEKSLISFHPLPYSQCLDGLGMVPRWHPHFKNIAVCWLPYSDLAGFCVQRRHFFMLFSIMVYYRT